MTPKFCGEDVTSHFAPFYERLMAAGWVHIDRSTPCAICGFSFGQEWSVNLNGTKALPVFMRVDLLPRKDLRDVDKRVVVSFELI